MDKTERERNSSSGLPLSQQRVHQTFSKSPSKGQGNQNDNPKQVEKQQRMQKEIERLSKQLAYFKAQNDRLLKALKTNTNRVEVRRLEDRVTTLENEAKHYKAKCERLERQVDYHVGGSESMPGSQALPQSQNGSVVTTRTAPSRTNGQGSPSKQHLVAIEPVNSSAERFLIRQVRRTEGHSQTNILSATTIQPKPIKLKGTGVYLIPPAAIPQAQASQSNPLEQSSLNPSLLPEFTSRNPFDIAGQQPMSAQEAHIKEARSSNLSVIPETLQGPDQGHE